MFLMRSPMCLILFLKIAKEAMRIPDLGTRYFVYSGRDLLR